MNPCTVPVPINSEDDRWISIVSVQYCGIRGCTNCWSPIPISLRSTSDFCPNAGKRIQTWFSLVIVWWRHYSTRKRGTNTSPHCIRSTLAFTWTKHRTLCGVFRTVFWTMLNQKWVFLFQRNSTTPMISVDFSFRFPFLWQIIVLHVGTNNVQNTAEEIADGITEIVKSIREKLPDVYIVLPVSIHLCKSHMFWWHDDSSCVDTRHWMRICFFARRHYYLVDIYRIRYVRRINKSINWLRRNIRRSVRIKCKQWKSIKA